MIHPELKDAQNMKALLKIYADESAPRKVCPTDTISAQKILVEIEIDD